MKFLKSWLGHLGGYVAAGAGMVAAIDPTFLPPVGKLAVSTAALIVIATHHAYTAGSLATLADQTKAAISKLPPAAAAMLAMAIIVGSSAGLSGCATVQGLFASPAAPVVIAVSVDVAVAAAEQHGVSVQQINAVAKIALAASSSTGATLATVSSAANAEITKLNLNPLDVAAADALEAVITATVTQKLAGNADLAAAQADVAQVLQAVIAATGG